MGRHRRVRDEVPFQSLSILFGVDATFVLFKIQGIILTLHLRNLWHANGVCYSLRDCVLISLDVIHIRGHITHCRYYEETNYWLHSISIGLSDTNYQFTCWMAFLSHFVHCERINIRKDLRKEIEEDQDCKDQKDHVTYFVLQRPDVLLVQKSQESSAHSVEVEVQIDQVNENWEHSDEPEYVHFRRDL